MNVTRSILERLGHDSLVDLALTLAEELEVLQDREEEGPEDPDVMWGEANHRTFYGTTGAVHAPRGGPGDAQNTQRYAVGVRPGEPIPPEAVQSFPDVDQTENDSQLAEYIRDDMGTVWEHMENGWYLPKDPCTRASHRLVWIQDAWGPTTVELEDEHR